ncbi:hypothetical protein [Sabulibacter ruber]|uniref:hypothetical protein n=1 Tax=Sabulibacter ruber TaxID=2811901 RepID=UPI001A974A02|nr:hypothetical protein [Sabulibacter ruber]
MKQYLLTLVLCAFALSFAPVATAAPEVVMAKEELPFFKKKKKYSKARYKQIKRNNGSYTKKYSSNRKKKSLW